MDIITIFCIFIPLILLTLEGWWFWYWFSFGDITHGQLYIIEIIVGTLIFLTIFEVVKGLYFVGFIAIPIPLIIWFLMKQYEDKTNKLNALLQEKEEINNLLNIIENAKEPALLYKALVELGDLYIKKEKFEKGIDCYKRANEIAEKSHIPGLLGLSAKIKLAEKEIKIKKGEIWVCNECSYDNPGNTDTCKICGNKKDVGKSIKSDIVLHKQEIKKEAIPIIFVGITIIIGLYLLFFLVALFGFLYSKHFPLWIYISLIIVISTLVIFLFFKFIVAIRNKIISKFLK
ncbi:MAG TPA: hypothetical protein PLW95_03785 [bacterium]|nr:hypothetical protein [bacterium]